MLEKCPDLNGATKKLLRRSKRKNDSMRIRLLRDLQAATPTLQETGKRIFRPRKRPRAITEKMIDSDGPKIDGMPLKGSKRVALSRNSPPRWLLHPS